MDHTLHMLSASYLPHGHCFFWEPAILWLNVISDLVITLAYYSIPAALIYLVKNRKDLAFNWLFFMFAAFIFACGTSHLFAIWTIWHGNYLAEGLIKAVTAVISISTAIYLWPIVKQLIKFPSLANYQNSLDSLAKEVTERQNLERELSETNVFLDSVIEFIPDMIFIKDAKDLRFIKFNKACEDILGLSSEDVIGKTDYDFFPKEQADRFIAADREVLKKEGSLYIREEPIDSKDRGRIYLQTKKIALKDERGVPLYLLGISQDVTAQKASLEALVSSQSTLERRVAERTAELERNVKEQIEAENRFQLAVESAPNAMVMVDSQGIITLVNSETERIFGYSRDQLLGKSVDMLVPIAARQGHPAHRGDYNKNPMVRPMGVGRDLYALRKDGSEFPVEIRLNPIKSAKGSFVIAGIVDISQRKAAEIELRNRAVELEITNKELDQFAYIASHDLKAPLRAINTLAGLIKNDLADKLSQDSKDNLVLMQNRIQRMEGLLNALLQYSRVGRVKYQSEEVQLQALVENIVELLVPPETFKVILNSELQTITTTRVPLDLVLRNLVGNAIKHHHRGEGIIEISIVEDSRHYVISVKDDGPGIAKEYFGKIFEMFQTLRPRDEVEGSGMGLALVKKSVEMIGGSIDVESVVNQGTTFIVRWPIKIG